LIEKFNFRYPNILRINFINVPVGAASYGFKNDIEIKDFYNIGCDYSYKLLKKCIELENDINIIFKKHLNRYSCINKSIEIVWCDDLEVEIYNIDSSKFQEHSISFIKKDLKKLLFKRK
jgi:hypothetical protein